MKKLINVMAKGLAGCLFAALLAVNVQVGSANGFSTLNFLGVSASANTAEAKAGPIYCLPPYVMICYIPIYDDNFVVGKYSTSPPCPPIPQECSPQKN